MKKKVDKSEQFWRELFEPLILQLVNKCMQKYHRSVIKRKIIPIPATGISYQQRAESIMDERKIEIVIKIDLDVY